jgi:hypothetical protein
MWRQTPVSRRDAGGEPNGAQKAADPARQTLSDCATVRQRSRGCLSSMLVGYMRISTADERQSVDLQRDALLAAGVDERHLHEDRASGARDDRPDLKTCLADLKPSQSQTV